MVETAEVRKRVLRVIEQSQRAAQERRERAASASLDGERALRQVVAPVVKTIAGILTGEGFPFHVATPTGAVRLQAQATPDNFVEVDLDADQNPPALRVRVSRARGRRVLVDEDVMCSAEGLASLTEDDVVTCLVAKLGPFVER